jgi:hypothetical protein
MAPLTTRRRGRRCVELPGATVGVGDRPGHPLGLRAALAVFRSVVIPIKAGAINLLSIGAAYGVIVAAY